MNSYIKHIFNTKRFRLKKAPLGTPQSGLSIIEAIIVVSLLAFATQLALTSINKSKHLKTKLNAKKSASELTDAFESTIANAFYTSLTPTSDCPNLASLFSGTVVSNDSKIQYTLHPKPLNSSSLVLTGDVKGYNKAYRRCDRPLWPNNPNSNSQNKFKFCLDFNFSNTDSYQHRSFLNAEGLFAEVLVELSNFHTSERISCRTFGETKDESGGLIIYYSLYWRIKVGHEYHYKRKNSSFAPTL